MDIFELGVDQWREILISIIIVVGTIVFGRWIIDFLLKQIVGRLVGRTKTKLDDVVMDISRPILYLLAIVLAFQIALGRLNFIPFIRNLPQQNIFFVLYLLLAFVFLWRFISQLFAWYAQEIAPSTGTLLDEQMIPFFRRVTLIILTVIGLIFLLGRFNVDVSALITTLGVSSLAIALAAQATLADTISGFVIMIDRPFRIGDRVELLDLNTWGDVIDIGLRSSRIRTRDNRMVIVPNSVIGKSLIVNHSYPDELYRIQIHIGLAYGSDIEFARQAMVNAVQQVEGVSEDHPVEALFLEFGDSAMIFRVRWWINSYVDTRRMFDRVNTELYHALDREQIVISSPLMEVHHQFGVEATNSLREVFRGKGRPKQP